MVLEYWPTKLGHVWCKCSNIFHKYDLGEFPWFLDACIMNMSHVFHWNILGTALKRTGQYNLWRLWWHGRMCHDRTASWPKGIPPFVAMKIVALLFYPVITIYIYTHIYIYNIYTSTMFGVFGGSRKFNFLRFLWDFIRSIQSWTVLGFRFCVPLALRSMINIGSGARTRVSSFIAGGMWGRNRP